MAAKRYASLETLMDQELYDVPSLEDGTELEAEFRRALLELPLELIVTVYAVGMTGGSLSALSRRLGRPRQESARRMALIREHFSSKGLA